MITFLSLVVALVAVGLVGWPLLRRATESGVAVASAEETQFSDLLAQKDATFLAISELETDHEMGNLSQTDYLDLKRKYEEKAMSLIKQADDLQAEIGPARPAMDAAESDEIEREVSQLRKRTTPPLSPRERDRPALSEAEGVRVPRRACARCGAAMDAGDAFCAKCGAAAKQGCPGCGARLEPADRFCPGCGASVSSWGSGKERS